MNPRDAFDRTNILTTLIEKGIAQGVITPSHLKSVFLHPKVAPHFDKRPDRIEGFIRGLVARGIEFIEIDVAKYRGLPMVLTVDNPVWSSFNRESVVGQTFFFPDCYKEMVLEGRPFLYFQSLRSETGERADRGYFGSGTIGELVPCPSSSAPITDTGKWKAEIVNYQPFKVTVPWKDAGQLLEKIDEQRWVNLIRDLSADTYLRIMELERSPETIEENHQFGGVDSGEVEMLLSFNKILEDFGIGEEPASLPLASLSLPNVEAVEPVEVDPTVPMMVARAIIPALPKNPRPVSDRTTISPRRSRYSSVIGLRAEEIVFRALQKEAEEKMYQSVRWVSVEGDKPGWDIEFVDALGIAHSIEVKGTSGPIFSSIEITAGEWQAASALRGRYWLYLVSNCTGVKPNIQRLQDPVSLVEDGTLSQTPVLWRLDLISPSAAAGVPEDMEFDGEEVDPTCPAAD